MNYFPVAPPFFIALFVFFTLIVLLIELRVVQFVYESVGVNPRLLLSLLLLSFLGSYINIGITQLPPEHIYAHGIVDFFGIPYVVPMVAEAPGTIIAVNVGGAIVPTLLSIYLIVKNRLYTESFIAIGIVSAVVHTMAHPVPGVGIAEPVFVPPLIAALSALFISREHAVPLAYAAGSMGTLIGADLLNLDKIQGLGAPVASIGGAGKFDGIFLTGLVAVLLASLVRLGRGHPVRR
jgi:uncharacterized membrane protein